MCTTQGAEGTDAQSCNSLWRPEFIHPTRTEMLEASVQPLGGTVGVTKVRVHFSDTERCSGLRLFPESSTLGEEAPNNEWEDRCLELWLNCRQSCVFSLDIEIAFKPQDV